MRRLFLVSCCAVAMTTSFAATAAPVTAERVVRHYAEIALATYQDALSGAQQLSQRVDALADKPSDATLAAARTAWIAARVPYAQTEAFRFANPVVDAWEGRVNAWPLDEGLIDYVDASYGSESDANAYYAANLIAHPRLKIGGREIDATTLNQQLLRETLHEVGGIEANVATGYHAIEFLLWGQDLNGTGPGAGQRPASDFDVKDCTGGNCQRRVDYLRAATALLVQDLEEIVASWTGEGAARTHVVSDAKVGLTTMLTGIGSLSYGELAGERMKLGLILHDPEEEQDCFSDNTHNSHYYNQIGIQNVYLGRYQRTGRTLEGPSLSDLVKQKSPELDQEMRGRLDETVAAMTTLKQRAETKEAYDQMIGENNAEGNAVVQAAIDRLIQQTRAIERVVGALGVGQIELEGSDSLDNPQAVFE